LRNRIRGSERAERQKGSETNASVSLINQSDAAARSLLSQSEVSVLCSAQRKGDFVSRFTAPLAISIGAIPQLVPDKLHRGSPWVNSQTRRSLDCVVAASALVVLSPIIFACAVLVRLSSPGPVLFRQRRMGRNGREFDFYKFRSMEAAKRDGAPGHTAAGDRRITPVGAFLRRYKLDELPQFWNVLKGDMSLVGPRPKLAKHEALRMAFRPGLTGEATLAFRNEEQLLERVPADDLDEFYERFIKPVKAELDSAYMQRASFRSDIRLLCRTAVGCFTGCEGRSAVSQLTSACKPDTIRVLHLVLGHASGSTRSNPSAATAD
jgi:lipopolysaccharide/colanic/teichoic acid biosynthesis glycosyltransferase